MSSRCQQLLVAAFCINLEFKASVDVQKAVCHKEIQLDLAPGSLFVVLLSLFEPAEGPASLDLHDEGLSHRCHRLVSLHSLEELQRPGDYVAVFNKALHDATAEVTNAASTSGLLPTLRLRRKLALSPLSAEAILDCVRAQYKSLLAPLEVYLSKLGYEELTVCSPVPDPGELASGVLEHFLGTTKRVSRLRLGSKGARGTLVARLDQRLDENSSDWTGRNSSAVDGGHEAARAHARGDRLGSFGSDEPEVFQLQEETTGLCVDHLVLPLPKRKLPSKLALERCSMAPLQKRKKVRETLKRT
ncbi:hypothetical protein SELMODRAFT_406482 [Selaginella moellendorffii]|uniref:Uncharacterized protein n=1 Tax=Selaginella moellendorffii TaxID=88036 RepID=D8R2I0_SELML|nr:hypothetical protein SELMODRAFT_406482 [Selaginella moellendorffii]